MTTVRLCIGTAVLLFCGGSRYVSAQNGSADWPQLRGPTGRGISTAKGLPTKWSGSENIAWKTELPGAGASTPIVVGGKIYVTCYRGYNMPGGGGGSQQDLERMLVCISPTDGKVLWEKMVPTKLPEQDKIREDHGYASGTPVADETNIYCFFGKSGVFAFDYSGNPKWHAEVGSGLSDWGSAGPLTLHGNLLLVNAWVESGSLIALDKKSGKEVWRAQVDQAWHAPLVISLAGKSELIVSMTNKIVGLDPANGKELWTCGWDNYWYKVPIPTEDKGVVYAIGGRSGQTALAVRAGGRGDVTDSHRLWTSTSGSNVSSPIYHEGHVYYISDSQGIAYCADAKTGKIVYEQRMPRSNGFYAAPILADGKIYYLDRSGRCFVVSARPQFELLANNDLGERSMFNASPAVAGSKLLIRSDMTLWCIGK